MGFLRNIIWGILCGLAVFLFGGQVHSASLEKDQYAYVRVNLNGKGNIGKKVLIAGAKNEYLILPFRISGADVPTLKVEVKALRSSSQVHFKFYQLGSAPVGNQSRFQPDALFALHQGPLQRGGVMEVWAIVKIPGAISKGTHSYELLFSDNKASYRQLLDIKVWNFSLPDDLPIAILANLYVNKEWFARYGVNNQSKYDEVIRAYLQDMRKYRINALGKFYPFPVEQLEPGKRVEDFPAFDHMLHYAVDDLHYRYFRVPRVPGAKKIDQPAEKFVQRAKTFYPLFNDYLRRHNWEQRAIIKIIDEPKPGTYQQVYQAYSLVKSLVPNIKTESAGRAPDPLLAKVINIWVTYIKFYNPGKIAEAKKLGQEIWLYANKLHGIDQPLVNQRLIGWYLFQYNFSGYLLWGMDHWLHDPWTVPPGPIGKLRRGTFYYPNPRTGLPMPTTRLESLRQGFQDYQYLTLFEQSYRSGKISQALFNKVSQEVRAITRDLNSLRPQVSMQQLEEIRYRIGEALDR